MSILFYFKLMSLKLEHALTTADLLNQNPTKKVMLLYKKIFLIGVANGYLSRVLNTIGSLSKLTRRPRGGGQQANFY